MVGFFFFVGYQFLRKLTAPMSRYYCNVATTLHLSSGHWLTKGECLGGGGGGGVAEMKQSMDQIHCTNYVPHFNMQKYTSCFYNKDC